MKKNVKKTRQVILNARIKKGPSQNKYIKYFCKKLASTVTASYFDFFPTDFNNPLKF